jgi:hypothetical protein
MHGCMAPPREQHRQPCLPSHHRACAADAPPMPMLDGRSLTAAKPAERPQVVGKLAWRGYLCQWPCRNNPHDTAQEKRDSFGRPSVARSTRLNPLVHAVPRTLTSLLPPQTSEASLSGLWSQEPSGQPSTPANHHIITDISHAARPLFSATIYQNLPLRKQIARPKAREGLHTRPGDPTHQRIIIPPRVSAILLTAGCRITRPPPNRAKRAPISSAS